MSESDASHFDERELTVDSRGPDGDFHAFYSRHVGWVYSLSLRITADPAVAREAVQDVFVRAWRKSERYRGGSATAWLRQVALRVLLNRERAAQRWKGRLEETDLADLPARTVDRVDDRLALEEALQGLPHRARTVVVLHDVEGYTMEEIAAQMGTVVGTVKSQLHRGRRLLRQALED